MEDHNVEQAWSVASHLAEAGIDSESLALVESQVGEEALGDALSRVVADQRTVTALASGGSWHWFTKRRKSLYGNSN